MVRKVRRCWCNSNRLHFLQSHVAHTWIASHRGVSLILLHPDRSSTDFQTPGAIPTPTIRGVTNEWNLL